MNDIYFTLELLGRIGLAALCGIAIGYERMNHYKAAGVKTHMIVGLSAALMMIVSKYGFSDSAGYDASRVAAQVVSGVGFLGAGIIFKKNQNVQGLTTAAGIWGTSGVGLALGSGLYYVGVFGTVMFILLRVFVQNIERLQNGLQETYSITLNEQKEMNDLLSLCDNLKVIAYALERKSNDQMKMNVTVMFNDEIQKEYWLKTILTEHNVIGFEHY